LGYKFGLTRPPGRDYSTESDPMIFQWFDARAASEAGEALADEFVSVAAGRGKPDVAQLAEGRVRQLKLNVYQRAKLVNAFKWRLLEKGVDKSAADDAARTLLMTLMGAKAKIQRSPT
jgi:hypothetical protein